MLIFFTRVFQFLWLTQTVLWVFSKLKMDSNLAGFVADNHTPWVVFYALVLSLSIFQSLVVLVDWVFVFILERVYSKKLVKIVRDLKPQDKHILSKFINDEKREIFLSVEDLSPEWLVSNKIIIKTGLVGNGKKFSYKLAVWARDYIIRNPNLIY